MTKLQSLFGEHEFWESIKDVSITGVKYNVADLTEERRLADLKFILARGNHKSAAIKENEPSLLKNYEKEVAHGWMMSVTVE